MEGSEWKQLRRIFSISQLHPVAKAPSMDDYGLVSIHLV